MKKLAYKIGLGLMGGTVVTLMTASSAFAAGNVNLIIKGNGAGSRNSIRVRVGGGSRRWRRRPRIVQRNFASVGTTVIAGVNTGNNDANNNTGGKVEQNNAKGVLNITVVNNMNKNKM